MNISTADLMYSLSIDQTANLIATVGDKQAILVEGEMGIGKSSLLKLLAQQLPKHRMCYVDCTTKDLGDIVIPHVMGVDGDSKYVTYVPNEEFGFQHDQPVVIMLDEFGKALQPVKQGLTRLVLEHSLGNNKLPEGSIVFLTTNLGAENVGDLLDAHQHNRVTRVRMRKPSIDEYLEYGINNDFEPALLAWVRDNPHTLQSFQEVKNPDENPYIFHPKAVGRTAFFSPRSGEKASDVLKQRAALDQDTLTAALIGTIGDRGAKDLMAHVTLIDQLPTLDDIKADPLAAKVPTSAAAVVMVVFRALSNLSREWIDAWMDYLNRLDAEAQGLFARACISEKYSKRAIVMQNKKFTEWCMANNYMFTADKK